MILKFGLLIASLIPFFFTTIAQKTHESAIDKITDNLNGVVLVASVW